MVKVQNKLIDEHQTRCPYKKVRVLIIDQLWQALALASAGAVTKRND